MADLVCVDIWVFVIKLGDTDPGTVKPRHALKFYYQNDLINLGGVSASLLALAAAP
jgi:hypothetical protein